MDDHAAFLQWLDEQALPRTPLYDCPYLEGRQARQYGFAAERLPAEVYVALMDRGFRRSGAVFYAMECPGCRACVPLRVPTATFRPSRSQRRALAKNRDVTVDYRAPVYSEESFALYRRYLAHQHPGSPQSDTQEDFADAFYRPVVEALEARYFVGDRLIGVSLLDVGERAWSSVYHFFDPEERSRSVGVYSVVAEIAEAKRRGVEHYHLGFWIEGAKTMAYKADFGPHELLQGDAWRPA
ncbi:MAG: arginyltransferase [Planctomycetota bacterium]